MSDGHAWVCSRVRVNGSEGALDQSPLLASWRLGGSLLFVSGDSGTTTPVRRVRQARRHRLEGQLEERFAWTRRDGGGDRGAEGVVDRRLAADPIEASCVEHESHPVSGYRPGAR